MSIYIRVPQTTTPTQEGLTSRHRDIIKLLNEPAVLVEEELFSEMGLHNHIALWATAHAGGRLLFVRRTDPNTHTHVG